MTECKNKKILLEYYKQRYKHHHNSHHQNIDKISGKRYYNSYDGVYDNVDEENTFLNGCVDVYGDQHNHH